MLIVLNKTKKICASVPSYFEILDQSWSSKKSKNIINNEQQRSFSVIVYKNTTIYCSLCLFYNSFVQDLVCLCCTVSIIASRHGYFAVETKSSSFGANLRKLIISADFTLPIHQNKRSWQ